MSPNSGQIFDTDTWRERMDERWFDTGVAMAEKGDVGEGRKTATQLSNALKEIDASQIPKEKRLTWKELAMSLNNDAVELTGVRTADEFREIAEGKLRGRIGKLHEMFGDALMAARAISVPEQFKKQLATLWPLYLKLQAALAGDDAKAAAQAARAMHAAVKKLETPGLTGASAALWERERENLIRSFDRMGDGADIERIRHGFALLSDEMAALIVIFNLDELGPVYQHHCPMAFNDRGAAWLQADDDTRNPYFGASMLKCADWVEPLLGD